MSKKSFKSIPIPHRAKNGIPVSYFILSIDDKQTEVSRLECLASSEDSESQYPQRWFVDEESGIVIRLPRNEMGEKVARENMRSIWREAKYQERWAGRTLEPTVDDDVDKVLFEPADDSKDADVAGVLEEKNLLDTLKAALSMLTQEDRNLIKDIFWGGKTERQLAPELGLKEPKSVNKRKHRILEILRKNEALKSFF